jgi:transcriptional regulator with XRE-family HTH domain
MTNDLLVSAFLFKLLEAAGISKKDIASRLRVSKTLVTLWSQAKRSISWAHYEALLDLVFDPETIWKIARRLKTEGPVLGVHPFQELTPNYLIYKLISLSAQHRGRTVELYEDIKSITQQMAACTSGEPATWNIPALQKLSHRLTDHLKDAPLLTMQLEPRLGKALQTLNDALEGAYYQEDTNATTHDDRGPSGEFNN